MRIKKITSQHRRDFRAVYQCDHCDHEHEGAGYDDANFHQNVIPKMKCTECGLDATDDYRALAPKYPDNAIV